MTDTRGLCREAIMDALSPLNSLGDGGAASEGAIYLWAKLPEGQWHMFTQVHHQHTASKRKALPYHPVDHAR